MRLSACLGSVLYLLIIGVASASSLQEAQRQFDAGNHSQALKGVQAALAETPKNPEARFLKGLILVQQGEDTQAIAVFNQLTADYPDLPEPYNNLAVLYAARGDYENAQNSLKAALKTHPSYTTAYVNLGDIYAKLASDAYQQALELDNKDSRKIKIKLALINKLLPVEPVAKVAQKQVEVAQVAPKDDAWQPAVKVGKKDNAVPAKSSEANKGDVIKAIKNWAKAWSTQKVEDYLSYYDPGFKPASGTAKAWRKQRHIRLSKPEYIRIILPVIKVTNITSRTAEVHIEQIYESNTYHDETPKRIELRRRNNGWKIYRETAL